MLSGRLITAVLLVSSASCVCVQRMEAVEDDVLRRYLFPLRTEPTTPLNLDFDAFVGIYNRFVALQASGELVTILESL